MARKYTKKSDYWNNLSAPVAPVIAPQQVAAKTERISMPDLDYQTFGSNMMAVAAMDGSQQNTNNRGMVVNSPYQDPSRWQNLREGLLPYETINGRTNINLAIDLTQRAYANVGVFRNAIEILTEFSNNPVYLKGGTKKARDFVQAWFKKIGLNNFLDQYFREYYRSGNVFIYRFDGKLRGDDVRKLKTSMGASATKIPISYIILNPTNIFVQGGFSNGKYTYAKMLSLYEIMRLKDPQTDEEKELFKSLPPLTQQQIKNYTGGTANYIYLPIDPLRLYFIFYKKQSYEPLAIPMGFPVLNDIEWKLQLKKMDMAMSRSIEHAMLLVTTGEKVDQYGGGVNPNNVAKLQQLFTNPTIGRVLVADYTTKAEWKIPDIKELLGPAKYEVVDRDIREGLQSILLGDDKFANALMKAKIFMERLKDGQEACLDHWLQPEIDRICDEFGFKGDTPKAYFENVELSDEVQMHKVYLRLAELGMLTPDQATHAIETGILPDKEELDAAQEEYKSQRDKGFYYPIVGGSMVPKNAILAPPKPANAGPSGAKAPTGSSGRPSGTKGPKSSNKPSPIGTSKAGEDYKVSSLKVFSLMNSFDNLKTEASKALSEKFAVATLSPEQEQIAETLARCIFINEDQLTWKDAIAAYIKEPKEIHPEFAEQMDEVAMELDLDPTMAAIFVKARI